MDHLFTNKLINASSPYLLQHAHNPVDWWEWGDDAFEKATREDKLVLVSIGYSACHWCHVMEHECFEKEDTAAIMNAYFVCIKVDREERPDVDQIYMDAVQLLTGRGGWPLNCFVLPDGRPIHGGTYFPKAEWERTLHSLKDLYQHKKEDALRYATELTNGIKKLDLPETGSSSFSFEQLSSIIKTWSKNIDHELGGYHYAPKFPMPDNWELFMQFGHYSKDLEITQGVHQTLTKMAEGGIYDQLGGGFSRYSTDSFWKVPHFEKMLYDNAQLMGLYARASRQNREALYRHVVHQTHSFLQRELLSPEGLFYSALDADSEGVEGKFYIWTRKELVELLGSDEPLYSLYFSIDTYGNWENGENILYKTRNMDELKKLTGKTADDIQHVIELSNERLLNARNKRVRPGLDDKIITCWNALMISGYAEAYNTFGDEAYLNAAVKCADALLDKMWDGSRLHRIYKAGKISIHGFAEDYASLAESLIMLYEAGGNENYLQEALEITRSAIRQFYNPGRKMFYFKSSEDAQLITRKTDLNDDVIASANSMFAKVLYKLGFYFDLQEYHTMVDDMIRAVSQKLEKYPAGYSNWLQLVLTKQKGFTQVIICGNEAGKIKNALFRHYLPGTIIIAHEKESTIPLLKDKPVGNTTRIFICKDKTCGLPVGSLEEALNLLQEKR